MAIAWLRCLSTAARAHGKPRLTRRLPRLRNINALLVARRDGVSPSGASFRTTHGKLLALSPGGGLGLCRWTERRPRPPSALVPDTRRARRSVGASGGFQRWMRGRGARLLQPFLAAFDAGPS